MSERLTKAIETLRHEETSLQQRANTLRTDLKSTEKSLNQIRSALSALKGNRNENTGKPAAKKEDVSRIIAEIIKNSGAMKVNKLKEMVEERIVASGKSRAGLALRFKEVLKSKRFVRENDLVTFPGGNETPQLPVQDELQPTQRK